MGKIVRREERETVKRMNELTEKRWVVDVANYGPYKAFALLCFLLIGSVGQPIFHY